jgi:hypothetical protein
MSHKTYINAVREKKNSCSADTIVILNLIFSDMSSECNTNFVSDNNDMFHLNEFFGYDVIKSLLSSTKVTINNEEMMPYFFVLKSGPASK